MASQHTSLRFISRVLLFSLIFTLVQLLIFYRANQPSTLAIALNLIDGILLALVLGPISLHLPFNRRTRIAVIWLALFIIQEFSNTVEALFFTTYLSTTALFLAASLLGLVITLIEALAAGLLFNPQRPLESFAAEMRTYFKQRSSRSWLLRFAVGSLAYFPIYFTFGAMIAPFVLPYYQDPSMGLTIPSFTVMVPLEFFRGFLYVLALFPILATLRAQKRHAYFATVSMLYVAGALIPFLTVLGFPIPLRIFHGVEILADCLAYGAVLAYLFARTDM